MQTYHASKFIKYKDDKDDKDWPEPREGGIQSKGRNLRLVLPSMFGGDPVKTNVLPLGYSHERKPDPEKICDMPNCTVMDDTEWVLFSKGALTHFTKFPSNPGFMFQPVTYRSGPPFSMYGSSSLTQYICLQNSAKTLAPDVSTHK